MTTLREILGDDLFSERIEGIPRKMKGLVFGNEFNPEIHIREVEYIPGLPRSLLHRPRLQPSRSRPSRHPVPPRTPDPSVRRDLPE